MLSKVRGSKDADQSPEMVIYRKSIKYTSLSISPKNPFPFLAHPGFDVASFAATVTSPRIPHRGLYHAASICNYKTLKLSPNNSTFLLCVLAYSIVRPERTSTCLKAKKLSLEDFFFGNHFNNHEI